MGKATCGVYQIKNEETGASYIGQASNIEIRKKTHFDNLRKRIHVNRAFQKSYDESGEDAFSFRIILYCERFELDRYERLIIAKEKPTINKIIHWRAKSVSLRPISQYRSAAEEFEWCEEFYKKAVVITDEKQWHKFVSNNYNDLMRFYESRPQYKKLQEKKI